MQTILLATRNTHKLREVSNILGTGFQIHGLNFLDKETSFPEIEETGETFEENASLKAEAASLHFDGFVLADDSGLEVDALGGQPGVLSARFAGTHGDDAANNALLLKRLEAYDDVTRNARFRCALALAKNGKTLKTFSAAVEGAIANQPHGKGGFGYDPLFVPTGYNKSFAELGDQVKNKLSHRGRALAKLKAWLVEAF
ncbi:MAG: RdgB/HAM1 family non-canonical purine NTP pyrophosphatase [Chthoniobacterales bacterium]